MLARAPEGLTFDEFLAWEQRQPEKWEYVSGRAVLRAERKGWVGPRAMAGAARGHVRMVARIVTALNNRLGDGPCLATASDLRVRTGEDRYRYPDVTVDCGAENADGLFAVEPRALIEVLSPSNTFTDQLRLLNEYLHLQSLAHFVFVEPGVHSASIWTREADHWSQVDVEGIDAVINLSELGVNFPLTEIYRLGATTEGA